jgi:hypothetical protein
LIANLQVFTPYLEVCYFYYACKYPTREKREKVMQEDFSTCITLEEPHPFGKGGYNNEF